MKDKVQPIPAGCHTVSLRILVRGAANAIEFYQRAFGAIELGRVADPSGKIVNAEIKLGDSIISLADESPEYGNYSPPTLGGATAVLTLNVADADAVWNQAIAVGAKVILPLKDQPYGFRQGRLEAPFGHLWLISTQIEGAAPKG